MQPPSGRGLARNLQRAASRQWCWSGVAVALLVLSACGRRADPPELPLRMPTAFSTSGEAERLDRWWTAFDDPQLEARIQRALAGNFDLRAAWERLRAARAVVAREAGGRWPSLDAEATGRVQRSENRAEDGFDDDDADSEELVLGLSASYEVDLWGRIESQVEAAGARAEAGFADYRTAALSLAAEVATTWYRLVEARGQVALLGAQAAADEQVSALLRTRFGGGTVRRVDLLRQDQLVAATREDLATARGRVAVLEHRLAILEGRTPMGEEPPPAAGELPSLPPLPATGLPSDLVRRRPDVLAAHHRLRAANRDLAAAISDQYPRLTLSASISTAEDDTRDLFRNWLFTLAGNLVAPLFDGGRRAAEVDRSRAVERERLYAYAQTVLEAFAEVEDALVREARQEERLASLRRQVDLAETTADRLREEYLNGVSDYLDVLDARIRLRDLQRERLAARRELVELRIALYRALAGGFVTPLETGDGSTADDSPDAAVEPGADDGSDAL